VLEYSSPDSSSLQPSQLDPRELVTILRVGSMEAQLARLKLEAEGIHAVVANENISIIHPLAFSTVQLQVPALYAQRAEEILKRPPQPTDEGEYVEESYRCPKCHRKSVDLIRMSRAWRLARNIWLIALLLPLLSFLLTWIVPDPRLDKLVQRVIDQWKFAWMLFMFLVAIILIVTHKRRKRCRDCGHEWA